MISILLATYNGEKYLQLAIESILNQTFKNFELLIGFNGTTDNSKQIPLAFNDSRIRVFDYGNEKGKSKTLNKLLKESKFDWLAIQDDDDYWVNTKLEKQINYMENHDVIGTFINYINDKGEIIGEPKLYSNDNEIKFLSLRGDNQMANSSTIFKKKDAIEIGGWDENLPEDLFGLEDYDFWLKLMRKNKTFINVPDKLVHHRLHKDSNFNTKTFDLKKILQKNMI